MIADARSQPTSAPDVGPGLVAANFRLVAPRGFGDPHNSYPHGMTCFRGRLFVSTTRDNLVFLKLRAPFEIPLEQWPVPVPEDERTLDQRAQIWRFDPQTGAWDCVYVSPAFPRPGGGEIALSVGFRVMVVFQGDSDPAPALYAPTWCPAALGRNSVMVRSTDGERFEECAEVTLADSRLIMRSFRAVLPFRGRLFAAPTMANVSGQPNVAGQAAVFVTTDPAPGSWRLANPPDFGDPSNVGVFELGVFDGHLYAGTVNIVHGYQVWKTDAEGEPPFHWTRVLSHGAYRGKLNQGTIKMRAFRDHLYITSGIQNGGYDRTNNIGPGAAEMVRVAKDGSWDLIVGHPRDTPQGFKAPLSGYGAGFDNLANGYFWQMCEHDGWLYVSTFDSTVFVSFQEPHEMSETLRIVVHGTMMDVVQRSLGGFDLWRTADGVSWTPVSMNGFGNPFANGIRTMVSTDQGLFVGATNPFGPDVAVRRAGGWRYEPNPAGGLEIWLGTAGTSHPPPPSIPAVVREPTLLTGDRHADRAACETLLHDFFEGSVLRSIGYWREGVRGAGRASEELVIELLSLLRGGEERVGDLGTTGATTHHLLRHFAASSLVGICADSRTARACRRAVPGPEFVGDFRGFRLTVASLDAVICVERLPVDATRVTVLREVVRVLRPGGRFVAAEMLRTSPALHAGADDMADPHHAIAALREELHAAGFAEVTVIDATYRCWARFMSHYQRHFGIKRLARQIDDALSRRLEAHLPTAGAFLSHYVLVSADAPEGKEKR
jgi:SAM-dependent methyltransferase